MRIGMLLDKTYPPDIRIDKEARTLLESGYLLSLLAYEPNSSPVTQEPPTPNVEVTHILRPGQALSRFGHRWNALRFVLTFRDGYWMEKISDFVRAHSIDVLHVHDLPLAGNAIHVGNRLSVPVVVDLHEHFPVLRSIRRQTKDPRAFIKGREGAWERYEGRVVRAADRVVVVAEESRQRIIKQHEVKASKVIVAMNAVDVENFEGQGLRAEVLRAYDDNFIIGYVGGADAIRGLNTAIEALTHLQDLDPPVKLLIVGARDEQAVALERLAIQIGVADSIEVLGWQPFSLVPSYIKASDVCILPLDRNPHTDSILAHKFFQYMLASRPVVVSDCPPMVRIVNMHNTGLVFRAGDSSDLARQIKLLHGHPSKARQLGRNGRNAVLEHYNWSTQGSALLQMYREISAVI